MKDQIQQFMDEYEETSKACSAALAKRDEATRELDEQVVALVARITFIRKEFEAEINAAMEKKEAAEASLKTMTKEAWDAKEAEVFPVGIKRCPLYRGAYVQISERIKREVIDASAAVRFIVEEGIEDTSIKKLVVENDVIDAVLTIKKEFPGVKVSVIPSVSVSLPKTKKEAK